MFARVHLTGGGVRGIARTIRRRAAGMGQAGWRRAAPAGVAVTAALGVIVGVGVTVLGGAPSPDGVAAVGAGSAPARGTSVGGTSAGSAPSGSPSSVAALPPVSPVT